MIANKLHIIYIRNIFMLGAAEKIFYPMKCNCFQTEIFMKTTI